MELLFFRDVGDPLYLTPYLDRGDITTAQNLARVRASEIKVKPFFSQKVTFVRNR